MAVTREVCVDVPASRRARALAAVHGVGVMGVQVRDRATGAPAGRVQVLAWLPPTEATVGIVAALEAALGPTARVSWRDVPVTWEAAPAHPVGRGFVVVGPGAATDGDVGDAGAARSDGRVPLVLDGALAFGDGLHPTTALCVEALEALALAGRSVLDVGTGTGILALVAARLGARPVVAQDIDPLAVWAARRTVAENAVAVEVVDALPDARFDLVVANLYLAPLRALLPTLAARRAPGGALLVSGFTEDAGATVRTELATLGLRDVDVSARDGWLALLVR